MTTAVQAPGRAATSMPVPTWIRAAFVLLVVAQATLLYKFVLVPKGPAVWDPAHHMMWGMTVYSDVVSGNFISFVIDSYRQVYWPFFHSWVITLSMMLFGPTVEAARLSSLWAWAFSAVAIAALTMRVNPQHRFMAVGISAGLWMTAARFIEEYATEALRESLAIGVTLGALWLLSRALESDHAPDYCLAGFAAMLTYFTKTEYGILLMSATAAAIAPNLRQASPDRVDARNVMAYLLPIGVLSVIWFAYPAKITATIRAMVNQPLGPFLDRWFPLSFLLFSGLVRYGSFVSVAACRSLGAHRTPQEPAAQGHSCLFDHCVRAAQSQSHEGPKTYGEVSAAALHCGRGRGSAPLGLAGFHAHVPPIPRSRSPGVCCPAGPPVCRV